MIGLKIKLTLDKNVLEEIELRDMSRYLPRKTEVIRTVESGKIIPSEVIHSNSDFLEAYKDIMKEYYPKLMSNERLVLSINSFVYSRHDNKPYNFYQ